MRPLQPLLLLACAVALFILPMVWGEGDNESKPGLLPAVAQGPKWLKGNLHTHSLWSDGDDYPEMIADWYKRAGYHFLALSDHNILSEGTRWFELKAPVSLKGEVVQRGGGAVLEKYLARFGPDWVEQRMTGAKREVRLKPLAEYRPLVEESGRFLMIPGMEVTSSWKRPKTATEPEMGGPVHMNLTNPVSLVAPIAGDNAVEIMRRSVDAVLAQREKTGQPMFLHLNHPNFVWGVTAEELMQVHGEKFFEVYNGHPSVHNEGDTTHAGLERMWDIVLAWRIAQLDAVISAQNLAALPQQQQAARGLFDANAGNILCLHIAGPYGCGTCWQQPGG